MRKQKNFTQRLGDLHEHATLLSEACDRFYQQHKLNEIRNISARLRILICCSKRGEDNILFKLTENDPPRLFVLQNYCEIKITEIEAGSDKVVQEVVKRKLITKPIIGQPTLPIITTRDDFAPWLANVVFEDWLENGTVMDWEIPSDRGETSKIIRLSPRQLIKAYADTEASHSDKEFAKEFGRSVEEERESYIFNGKPLVMPVVYNYLYQIGKETAKVALDFCNQNLTAAGRDL